MTKNNSVEDNELLYRRIKDNDNQFTRYFSDEHGNLKKLTRIGFYDSEHKISVYRARLMKFNPHHCRISDSDGVVALSIKEVSTIEIKGFAVKVCAKPEDITDCQHGSDEYFMGIAHAIIYLICIDEEFCDREKQAFKTLMQALTKQPREWTVRPQAPKPIDTS